MTKVWSRKIAHLIYFFVIAKYNSKLRYIHLLFPIHVFFLSDDPSLNFNLTKTIICKLHSKLPSKQTDVWIYLGNSSNNNNFEFYKVDISKLNFEYKHDDQHFDFWFCLRRMVARAQSQKSIIIFITLHTLGRKQ